MDKALILAGGNIAKKDLVKAYIDETTDIICVDRGCDFAQKNKLNISIAIGDFDSIDSKVYDQIKNSNVKKLTFNKDKDQTDMQLALEYCAKKGYEIIYLFGGLGTRMDHSMANIYFLYKFRDDFKEFKIIDDTNRIFLIKNQCEIKNKQSYNLSFMIASNNPIITITGVKWPLYSHKMVLGDSLTISNEIIEDKAFVKVENGLVFCFLSKD